MAHADEASEWWAGGTPSFRACTAVLRPRRSDPAPPYASRCSADDTHDRAERKSTWMMMIGSAKASSTMSTTTAADEPQAGIRAGPRPTLVTRRRHEGERTSDRHGSAQTAEGAEKWAVVDAHTPEQLWWCAV